MEDSIKLIVLNELFIKLQKKAMQGVANDDEIEIYFEVAKKGTS